MKLFHLSDFHLGKRLNQFSLLEDQQYILKEILEIASRERPDGVMIAGDVYDHTVPSEEAMKLWDDFLVNMAELKVPVFAISGNHDSAIRFSDHGKLMESAGIHLSPAYDGTVKHCILEDGEGAVNIYLLPFVKPAVVRSFFPEEKIESYTDGCLVALGQIRLDPAERNVLIAHQYVTGAVRSESEEVTVGGLDNVDASVFEGFDYVALGHIHGKQSVGKETVRYCGTPLKYSFAERNQEKTITVVELGAKGDVRISELPLKPKRDLREIKGTYEELTAREFYEGIDREDYIRAVLTDPMDIPEAMGKLRVIYPNILVLAYENERTKRLESGEEEACTEGKTPLEIFADFYQKQNNQPMSEEQEKFLAKCIEEIWEGI